MGGQYPEATLIDDFREGSKRACDELYNRCYYRLFIFCMDMIDDQMAAEDIAVETISKLFNRNKDFDSVAAIMGFVLKTARNACIDYIRKREREQAHHKRHIEDIESAETWKAQLIESEKVQAVIATIRQLSESQRRAIELYYFQGMSHKEIAVVLKVNSKSVEKILERGRHAIRELLSPAGHKPSDVMVVCMLVYLSQYCK